MFKKIGINNLKKLEELFKNKIDYVMHCVSLNESLANKYKKLTYSTALKGTENLLKLSIKYNVIFFLSFAGL